MKAFIYVLLAAILCTTPNILFAQHKTKNSGTWNNNNTWINTAPPYSLGNNSTVRINPNNNVSTNQSISFNNNGLLEIFGELDVDGNIGGNNNLQIIVEVGAILDVSGDVDLNNNTTLIVNGEMHVNNLIGFNANTNYLLGNGNLYVSGDVSGFNTSLFGGSIIYDPLPIELISFEVYQYNNSVIIDWATATEINNDYFTIEKSKDLFHWDVVGKINGFSNSNELKYYSFCDVNISEGVWYYRLKQTDYDGNYEYFNAVSISISLNNNLHIICANNSYQNFELQIKTSSENATLSIYDLSGKALGVADIYALNSTQIIRLSIPNYKSGSILLLNLKDSKENTTIKYLVK